MNSPNNLVKTEKRIFDRITYINIYYYSLFRKSRRYFEKCFSIGKSEREILLHFPAVCQMAGGMIRVYLNNLCSSLNLDPSS